MDKEPLAKSGLPEVGLEKHSLDVTNYVKSAIQSFYNHWKVILGEKADKVKEALMIAAITHDLGKATTGFQESMKKPKLCWEFRHEVLSTSLLISGNGESESLSLAASAILTHHKGINDAQLKNDSCYVSHVSKNELLNLAKEKFKKKAVELTPYWTWIKSFWEKQPYLKELRLPESPNFLHPPAEFLKKLEREIEEIESILDKKALSFILTRGWLMASDHATSANLSTFISSIPKPSLPNLRPFQRLASETEGNLFLEAPTGSGKTIAAITWALRNRKGGERIFYLLPYQASIEAMANTLIRLFGEDSGKENVAVLHGHAINYAFKEHFEKMGDYEVAEKQAKRDVELNRLVHKPIKIATPFQLLKWLFGIPRFEIGLSEMVGGLFIFDEIHAYDAHVIALITEMIRTLKELGGRFLFMSATFPLFLKNLLQEALGKEAKEISIDKTTDDDWTCKILKKPRHILKLHQEPLEEMIPYIAQEIEKGKRVLIVANLVEQAQNIYNQLKERFNVELLHARFTRKDRVEKETKILNAIKRKGESSDIQALIATQVVEVSLDISFDTIFTEVAPVDNLLQRFGRVNRYGYHDAVDVHVSLNYDQKRLGRVYDLERISKTISSAPESGSPLNFEVEKEWIQKTYSEGWTEKEKRKFDEANKSFKKVIESLKPLKHLEEGEEEFYGLFQTVEILPKGLYKEYDREIQEKRYLLASQLLVPIPIGTFRMLKDRGLLAEHRDRTIIANIKYDKDLGLLSKEIDLDANFI